MQKWCTLWLVKLFWGARIMQNVRFVLIQSSRSLRMPSSFSVLVIQSKRTRHTNLYPHNAPILASANAEEEKLPTYLCATWLFPNTIAALRCFRQTEKETLLHTPCGNRALSAQCSRPWVLLQTCRWGCTCACHTQDLTECAPSLAAQTEKHLSACKTHADLWNR